MTDHEVVRYERRDGVAWVTIDRPEARNALSLAVREGLFAAARAFAADEQCAVMVLTGAGEVFCAGGDLKEMAENGLQVPPPDFVPQFGRNVAVPKPIIAAVNGPALAGGFLLTQQADLVVAADTATFGISEAKVGRGAPWAAPLPWLLPPRIALEMLMTGDPISAERAHALGLVNRVVPAADLAEAAQDLARRIACNAPLSVAAAKRMVYLTREHHLADAYDEAERIYEPVYRSRDAQEGPRAFQEKRAPRWEGR
jgi:enoyl-CoA hydratase/carnithine racemase